MTETNELIVILSPHYDDAVFSCGAAIHKWVTAGQKVLVLNICAASPDPNAVLSPIAQELQDRMGHGDIVDIRRSEDTVALNKLGVEHIELSFKDCIYRGPENAWYYQSLAEIFGEVHEEESQNYKSVQSAIEDKLPPNQNFTFLAPLGIGQHVDHQIVREAAESLRKENEGIDLIYYEDFPYADPSYPHPLDLGNTSSLNQLRAQSPSMHSSFLEITAESLEAKVEAVMSYQSQLTMMFGELDSIPDRVRLFAKDSDRLVERFWQVNM